MQKAPLTVCALPPEGWYCTRAPGHEGPCAAVQDEPTAIFPTITINGRQLQDALDAAWPDRANKDEGDTEVTLFMRPVHSVDDEGDLLPSGLYFYWTEYPDEGCSWLNPNSELEPALQPAQDPPVSLDTAKLLDDIKKALQLANKVGISRQQSGYAANEVAVKALVDLQISIEDRIKALGAGLSPEGQAQTSLTCAGCDPAEGFCKVCRDSERAAQLADKTDPGAAHAAPAAQQSTAGGAVLEGFTINLPWRVKTVPARHGTTDNSIVDAANNLVTSDEAYGACAPSLEEMNFIVAVVNATAAAPLPQVQSEALDATRLEFLMTHEAWIAWSKDGESCRVFHRDDDGDTGPMMGWVPEAWSHDPRAAIDAAMTFKQSSVAQAVAAMPVPKDAKLWADGVWRDSSGNTLGLDASNGAQAVAVEDVHANPTPEMQRTREVMEKAEAEANKRPYGTPGWRRYERAYGDAILAYGKAIENRVMRPDSAGDWMPSVARAVADTTGEVKK